MLTPTSSLNHSLSTLCGLKLHTILPNVILWYFGMSTKSMNKQVLVNLMSLIPWRRRTGSLPICFW